MTADEALAELAALGDAYKAGEMAAYHKTDRPFLGVAVPEIYECCAKWRADLSLDARIALASGLWDSNLHEARVAAAKLLVQARIKPDAEVWDLIASWVPTFDGWALADYACGAGARRLIADPSRLDQVEVWTTSEHMWTKRAAMVMTLPWTKMRNPKPADLEVRERVLGWAEAYVDDRDNFIQKSVSWWLRELGRHDPARVWAFLDTHGARMKRRRSKTRAENCRPAPKAFQFAAIGAQWRKTQRPI